MNGETRNSAGCGIAMKNSFRHRFPDRRGSGHQAGLGLVGFLPGYSRLNLLDERLDRIDRGSIPFMSSLGLSGSSNSRFVSSRH
jgi:hypothetical protein